ncbi:MAG TPA: hypothetical protein VFN78_12580 [Ktedonobacterales bacterium]|nr:hypothetical protein [Ktedonobacterales bacterium]
MVRLLRFFDDDVSRRRRRGLWRMAIMITVVKLLASIVLVALAWLALAPLTPGSFTPDGSVWNVLPTVIQTLEALQIADFAVAAAMIGPLRLGALEGYRRALVRAVAAHDPHLTRAITVIPSGVADVSATPRVDALTVGPLVHPLRMLGPSLVIYTLGALGGLMVFGLGVGFFVISLRVPPSFTHAQTLADWFEWLTFPCTLMLVGSAGVVAALVTRHYARMESQDMSASIDADGVTFARSGARGQSRLRWRDARGFALISFTDVMGRLHEVFALSSADEDFLWAAEYASPHAPPDLPPESASWRVSAHQLVDAVVQHTGLPLLDLSQTVAAVAATDSPMSPQAASTLLARASVIARERGDQTLSRELAQRLDRSGMRFVRAMRRTGRLGAGARRLSDAQRDETLRLTRELLPYYPLAGQTGGNPRARLLATAYWRSEIILVFVVATLAFALSISWFVIGR